jgi:hypothetical protein
MKNLLLLTAAFTLPIQKKINLTKPVVCVFQDAQFLSRDNQEFFKNSRPLIWKMSELMSETAIVHDQTVPNERVTRHLHKGDNELWGVSIFVPQQNGANIVTVWSNGIAYWAKHNEVGDGGSSQQFRGSCTNH